MLKCCGVQGEDGWDLARALKQVQADSKLAGNAASATAAGAVLQRFAKVSSPGLPASRIYAGTAKLQSGTPVRNSPGQLQSLMDRQCRLAFALKLIVLQACAGVRL